MNHHITLNPLDSNSIRDAIKKCNDIRNRFTQDKIDSFLDYIADAGAMAAQAAFGGAVKCTVQTNGNTRTISADGDAVVFLEFGAGATVNTGSPYAGMMPFPVAQGSYSFENEGEYYLTGYHHWHFGGREYTQVTPRAGMEQGFAAVQQAINDAIARWPV